MDCNREYHRERPLTFSNTRDFALIREVLTHPTQYRMASDDSTPGPEDFRPNEDERIIYLACFAGIFTLIPQNAVCFEIHAAILPEFWGIPSREALKGAVQWAWQNSPARRIVASIPAYNRLAIKLAKDSGFIEFGRNPQSFLRGERLHDQVLLGVSRAW